jgi:hypothetical protein
MQFYCRWGKRKRNWKHNKENGRIDFEYMNEVKWHHP